MKKIIYGLFFLSFISSCTNEIDLFGEWENVPVVYGLIEAGSSEEYIRLEKVFRGIDGNAFDAALTADSLYYTEDAVVQIENVTTGESTILQKVNASETLGWDREDGLFASDPNYLYKIEDDALTRNTGDDLRFTVTMSGEETPLTEAVTKVIQPIDYKAPSTDLISFKPDRDTRFIYEFGPNTGVFDLVIYINIDEFDLVANEASSKSLKWIVATAENAVQVGLGLPVYELRGDNFFSFLLGELDEDPNVIRFFKDIDVEFIAGGLELKAFNDIALANTGITSSQEVPTYTNLSNGLGIISSKASSRVNGLDLTSDSKDLLRNSELTEKLNFE